MSAFKQKLARIGATAGVLAATTAAIMAVGGADASSALALTCPGAEAVSIQGRGSSLQRVGQEQWTGRVVPTAEGTTPYTELTGPVGYAKTVANGGCHEAAVSYTSTSSGSGLTAFRFTGTGSILTSFAFVGSDDGPTVPQIENAESATSKKAKPLIIPVAETAIGVPINLPSGCSFKSGQGLTWAQLNGIFAGTITTWNDAALSSAITGTCTGNITRVVRTEASGTSTQFKNYLAELQASHGGAAPGCGFTNWSELKAVGGSPEPNIEWPECRGIIKREPGGGEVAKFVAETHGTIGYAALPDVKSKSATPAPLQDFSEEGEARFAKPEAASGEVSNCGARSYTVPSGVREGESGVNASWFEVFGSNATVGGSLYPVCTLTYDIAWNNYKEAGYGTNGPKIAKNVKAYLEYVLTTGQSVGHWYQALPQPETAKTGAPKNVLGAAKTALALIS